MDDDWGSDDDQTGFGDISALPDLPPPPPPPPEPEPQSQPQQKPDRPPSVSAPRLPSLAPRTSPPPNAWANPGGIGGRLGNKNNNPGALQNSSSLSSSSSSTGVHHNPPPRSRPVGPATLFVSNLPFDTTEQDLVAFFSRAGVTPSEIRLIRQGDGRKVRGANVVLRPEVAPALALSLHGRPFRSRPLNIRRSDPDRDRSSSNLNDYNGPNTSTTSLPILSPTSSMDALPTPGGPNASGQINAPPGSAPPPTRKKLQLKPRTKPLPVLQVDARAVDGPRAGNSAPPPGTGNTPLSPTTPTVPSSGQMRGGRRPAHHRGGNNNFTGGRGSGRSTDRVRTPRGGDRMNAAFDSLMEAPSPGSSFGGGNNSGPGTSSSGVASKGPQSAPPPRKTQSNQDNSGGNAVSNSNINSNTGSRGTGDGFGNRANGGGWRGGSRTSADAGGAWTSARESNNKSNPSQSRDSLTKKEDEQKRPALVNAFAALEVNDSES